MELMNIDSYWNKKSIENSFNEIKNKLKSNEKVFLHLPVCYVDDTILDALNELNVEFVSSDGNTFSCTDLKKINNKYSSLIEYLNKKDYSPLEKFVVCYNIVTSFKEYKEENKNYYDLSRSPYLILNNDYLVCSGVCNFLYILCKKAGINIGIYYENDIHSICYVYLNDLKYNINGYFKSNPTNDLKDKENSATYFSMLTALTGDNDFEKFLLSDQKLLYSKDLINIIEYNSIIKKIETISFISDNEKDPIKTIEEFRKKFVSLDNTIDLKKIYMSIDSLQKNNLIDMMNKEEKYNLLKQLFFNNVNENIILGRSNEKVELNFVEVISSINSESTNNKKAL